MLWSIVFTRSAYTFTLPRGAVVLSPNMKMPPGLGTDFGGGTKMGISPAARSVVFTFMRKPPCMVVIQSSPGLLSYR